MGTEKQSTLKLRATPRTIGITVGLVLLAWSLNFIIPRFWGGCDWSKWGPFGDMFGAVNSLFSALAFVALVAAILLQREELGLQREELVDTRKELKGQREQLRLQKDQMEVQNFENRFFQMVRLWNELRASMKSDMHNVTGAKYFQALVMPDIQKRIIDAQSGSEQIDDSRCINAGVRSVFSTLGGGITNYMRLLYNIMKLIDQSGIDFENQKFYSNVVRAQLTQAELVVVFYDGLSELGREKFKPLIQKYSLLKHLDQNDLVAQSHPGLYDPKAFE